MTFRRSFILPLLVALVVPALIVPVLTAASAPAAPPSRRSSASAPRTTPDFDRVVFEFNGGVPADVRVRYVDRLIADGSGLPVRIAGRAVLRVRFEAADAHNSVRTRRRRHAGRSRCPT